MKASDNDFPSILVTEQGSTPTTPAASHQRLFVRTSDHVLCYVNSSGTVTAVGAGAGSFVSGEMAYVEYTSPVNFTATVEASANSIVSAGSVAFDGSTKVCIEFYSPALHADPVVGRYAAVLLFDGSTSLGYSGYVTAQVATNENFYSAHIVRYLTPSAASHTYSWRGVVSAGTGTANAGTGGAGTNIPGFIRISKA